MSAGQSLGNALFDLLLQHLLDLLSGVVVQIGESQLIAGLFPGHELSLDPQATISNFLSAIIAHFLSPDALFPK